jgi:hypothetical protein
MTESELRKIALSTQTAVLAMMLDNYTEILARVEIYSPEALAKEGRDVTSTICLIKPFRLDRIPLPHQQGGGIQISWVNNISPLLQAVSGQDRLFLWPSRILACSPAPKQLQDIYMQNVSGITIVGA